MADNDSNAAESNNHALRASKTMDSASGERKQNATDHLEPDDYFMSLAEWTAKRTSEPTQQAGAVIVNPDGIVVALGHNELPQEHLGWSEYENKRHIHNEHKFGCHAAMNAVLHRNQLDIKGSTIYTTHYPCFQCAKVIATAGLKTVVYLRRAGMEDARYIASKELLKAVKIEVRKFPDKATDGASDAKRQKLTELHMDHAPPASYFMSLAALTAQRSMDPVTQVGAVIVAPNHHHVVSLGYNDLPADNLPWESKGRDLKDSKHGYVCHAEMRAIVQKTRLDITGSTIYVTHTPCIACARAITQAGISKVVYLHEMKFVKPYYGLSRDLLQECNIELKRFVGQLGITIGKMRQGAEPNLY